MEDTKAIEIASTLEEMRSLLERLMNVTQTFEKSIENNGQLTLELKKDYDNVMSEYVECCKKCDALINANEMPV